MIISESDECKLREASLAASSRLKRALLKEKEKNATLQTAFTELQVCLILTSCSDIACYKCFFFVCGVLI